MMKAKLPYFAKLIIAIPFLLLGIFHFLNAKFLVRELSIPFGGEWLIYLLGAVMIAASISVITGKQERKFTFLLGAFLLMYVLIVHIPNLWFGNAQSMVHLLKDISLAGAAFLLSTQGIDRSSDTNS